jgi:hypothetical protein
MSQPIGVSPSDTVPCGAVLNRILRKAPGHYRFPAGTFLIEETLRIPSGTRLTLDPGTLIRLADGAATSADDYLLTNANPRNGDEHITIEGGIFDGNQAGNPRPEGLFTEGYTGAMIHFRNVKHLVLKDATFTNAEAYYSRFTHVHEFHIENITFDSEMRRHNNDGIHMGGHCSHGVIRNLRAMTPGVTGDDLVALNADDALQRNEVRGMTCGPITDIVIENLQAHSCHTFVRLLSTVSPIRNITIRSIQGGCKTAAINADGARGCRVPVFDEAHPPTPDGIGLLENIFISGLRVHKMKGDSSTALIDLQERLSDFVLEDFSRELDHDLSPEAPSLRLQRVYLTAGSLDGQSLPSMGMDEVLEEHQRSISTLRLTTTRKPCS